MNRARILFCAGFALAGLGLAPLAARSPILIWNASASAPIGLYLLLDDEEPTVGDRVAYRPTAIWSHWFDARGYLPEGVPLLKPVAATAPSVVCRHGETLLIDGRKVARAETRDRSGRALPRWEGCVKLGSNAVFLLAADRQGSLDGRYFGPVDRRNLMGRVVPLRVWERVS